MIYKRLVSFFSSIHLTITLLILLFILTFLGTFSQVELGIYQAQLTFFRSFWVILPIGHFNIPVFPGGYLIGWMLIINLMVSLVCKFKFSRANAGLLMTHIGLVVLLLGSGMTTAFSIESQLSFSEGESKYFSQDFHLVELVFINDSLSTHDLVYSISGDTLKSNSRINDSSLPFTLRVHAYFENAGITISETPSTIITHGVGKMMQVYPKPFVTTDDKTNNQTAIIEVFEKDISKGVWLISKGLGSPQIVAIEGQSYKMDIRPKRYYTPYSLTLKDFSHDVYPGTDIPRNYSSLVTIKNPLTKETRDTLIYMNHPLRYDGKTYYQASFGDNDTLSVLQVVENPTWLTPYISCLMIAFGLLWHLTMMFQRFLKRTDHD